MRQIVSNTGPVLHLLEIGSLGLLQFAGEVRIPYAVDRELNGLMPDWPTQRPVWLNRAEVAPAGLQQTQSWLDAGAIHAGEAAALALARQVNAAWFLTDDTAARLIARTIGLEVHGSLGLVLWAAATRHLDRDQAARRLENLASSSLWVSPRILTEARAALSQLYPG